MNAENDSERIVGARAWRVVFALVSLPLAATCIIYWINHRYDGAAFFNLRQTPG